MFNKVSEEELSPVIVQLITLNLVQRKRYEDRNIYIAAKNMGETKKVEQIKVTEILKEINYLDWVLQQDCKQTNLSVIKLTVSIVHTYVSRTVLECMLCFKI